MTVLTPTFPVTPLIGLDGSDESRSRTSGVPGHPPICGPGGEYFGHEWSRWRYDTLDARVDSWLSTVADGADILDLGCASGERAAAFARAGHRVVAVDCNDQAAAIAERNIGLGVQPSGRAVSPIRFLQADLREPIRLTTGLTLDLIHLRRVLNFITLEQFAARLDDVLPSLNETGWIVASFIATGIGDVATMTTPAASGSGGGLALYPGLHAYPFGDVAQVLQAQGLVIIEAFSNWATEAGFVARKRSDELCGSGQAPL